MGGFGLAVPGCGWIAHRHAAAAKALGERIALSFASRDERRAETYRARYGGMVSYGSYEAAVADPTVEGVTAWGYREQTGWQRSAGAVGGGALIDGGIHYVDLLLQWGGQPARVFALVPPKSIGHMEGEDALSLLVHLDDSIVGLLSVSLAVRGVPRLQWSTLIGTRGALFCGTRGAGSLAQERAGGQRVRLFLSDRRGYRAMLTEFVEAVRAKRLPEMDGVEARRDLALVVAAYRSREWGSPVEVE